MTVITRRLAAAAVALCLAACAGPTVQQLRAGLVVTGKATQAAVFACAAEGERQRVAAVLVDPLAKPEALRKARALVDACGKAWGVASASLSLGESALDIGGELAAKRAVCALGPALEAARHVVALVVAAGVAMPPVVAQGLAFAAPLAALATAKDCAAVAPQKAESK
jgi:hypothetical protein